MSYIGNQPTTAAFVTDQFSANGSGTVFTLSVAPANTSSILVAVSGVLQDPSTYSVAATTLTFSAAPPAGTGNISVRFLGIPASGVTTTAYRTVTEFTATASQTTFTPPSYTAGYISVYRNGVLLGSADYTASNGTTVVLATGATAGDLITTESFYVSSVLNAIPATAGAVTQAYIQTGVGGTGPTFSVYSSTNPSISNNTATKIPFNTKVFDTNTNFDTTNNRFTPSIAGYYEINLSYLLTGTSGRNYEVVGSIYKNGSAYLNTYISVTITNGTSMSRNISAVIYLNGSTDYVEGYTSHYDYTATSTMTLYGGVQVNNFSGSLVRAA